MAKTILGKVGFSPKGAWVSGTSYVRLDIVSGNGGSYLSMVDNNTSELSDASKWMQVAAKGDKFVYADFTPEQMALLKGEPFTYADFTPEQIALLQKPATDAAGVAATAAEEADAAREGIQTALAGKVDKVFGKGLSTNDYTDEEKNKLEGIDQVLDGKLDKNTGGIAEVDTIGADDYVLASVGNAHKKIKLSNLPYAGGDGTFLGTRCFGIEISKTDNAKTVKIIGNVLLYNEFKKWVDESPAPCEVEKNGNSFSYLIKNDFSKRTDGIASAWNTGNVTFLQMVELENINIGYFEDDARLQVWFNMDADCPAGFRRWLKNDKKLFARYNSIPNEDGTTMNVTKGLTHGSNNLGAVIMRNKTAATMSGLLEVTAWELIVLSWMFTAYYKTVNHQSVFQGIDSGSEAVARAYVQGSTDSLTTPHGQVTVTVAGASVKPYRFMYMENAIHGLQWIWGAGAKTNGSSLWICYDDVRANEQSALENLTELTGFEYACAYPTDLSSTYPKNVNFFTVCKDKGGSSTTGFCDGHWSNANNGNVFYRGGASDTGALCGGFALGLNGSPSGAGWNLRGRCALNR